MEFEEFAKKYSVIKDSIRDCSDGDALLKIQSIDDKNIMFEVEIIGAHNQSFEYPVEQHSLLMELSIAINDWFYDHGEDWAISLKPFNNHL